MVFEKNRYLTVKTVFVAKLMVTCAPLTRNMRVIHGVRVI